MTLNDFNIITVIGSHMVDEKTIKGEATLKICNMSTWNSCEKNHKLMETSTSYQQQTYTPSSLCLNLFCLGACEEKVSNVSMNQ